MSAKRSRSANWEQMEKSLLKTCIKEHLSIIECKTCDTNTNKSKQQAWKQVLQRFNELNHRHRTMNEVKQQWRTLKLEAKKSASDYKRSLRQTSGGMKPPSPDANTQEIIDMIPQEFVEDINVFDSDNNMESKINIAEREIMTEENFSGNVCNQVEQDRNKIISVVIPEDNLGDTPNNNNQIEVPAQLHNKIQVKIPAPVLKHVGGKKKIDSAVMKNRDIVLIECLKAENALKLKQMAEAHEWARQEHELKMEKIKLKIALLKKQIKDID